MNLDETTDELDARTRMAGALQSLGHHLVGHRVDPDLANRIAATTETLTAEVATRPSRDRTAEMAANPRFATLLSGATPEPIGADGNPMDLFRDSIVSGRTNPMGIGLEVRRHGDTVLATTTLGPAFEGAPGRAHGGVLSALVDHVLGAVLYPVIERGHWAATTEFKLNLLAAVRDGTLTACSTIVSLTRRTAVVQVEVDNDGRPCGLAQGTVLIAKPRQP